MTKETVVLDTFEGHMVLLCKGWYIKGDTDFFDAMRRLWVVRCGLPNEYATSYMDENIADSLFKIMNKCSPERMVYFHQVLHREISQGGGFSKPKDMSAIQSLIWEYRAFLCQIMIREDGKLLVSLPKAKKQIVGRIIRGNGRFKDYDKLVKADKRNFS